MAETTQLSWQSAFWARVTIALNSMALPSGRVLGLPSTWNFALRSSPLFCALATVYDIWLLSRAVLYKWSLTEGLERWRAIRFQGENSRGHGSFESLRNNKALTVLLFAFGALPQLVKINATRSIPLTQTCSAMYMATFGMDTLVLFTTKAQPPQNARGIPTEELEDLQPRRAPAWFSNLAIGATLSLLCSLCLFVLWGSLDDYEGRNMSDKIFLLVILLGSPIVALLAWLIVSRKPHRLVGPGQVLIFTGGFLMWVISGCPGILDKDVTFTRLHLMGVVAIDVLMVHGVAMGTLGLYLDMLRKRPSTFQAVVSQALQIAFISLHFVRRAKCYRVYYDASSTSRPLWTGYLV